MDTLSENCRPSFTYVPPGLDQLRSVMVLVKQWNGIDIPQPFTRTVPRTMPVCHLYQDVYSWVVYRTSQQVGTRVLPANLLIDLPRFNLALLDRRRLESTCRDQVYSILPVYKRLAQIPTLTLNMLSRQNGGRLPSNSNSPLDGAELQTLAMLDFVSATEARVSRGMFQSMTLVNAMALRRRFTVPHATSPVNTSSTPVQPDLPGQSLAISAMPVATMSEQDTPDAMVNVMVRSLKGLRGSGYLDDDMSTLCRPMRVSMSIRDFHDEIAADLSFPSSWFDRRESGQPLVLTTFGSTRMNRNSLAPLSSLLSSDSSPDAASLLTVNISARILGGKGGFGSQLRAAGGRMSSRKNRNQTAEQQNASNRNLDGRRIRTVTEAKNLATYLAMKPDMDKKEREEKRKRWEAVVEAAERKEDELKKGKGGNVRLDGQWVEQKEEVETKTRDAVLAAMKAGLIGNEAILFERTGSESSNDAEGDSDEGREADASGSSASSGGEERATASKPAPAVPATRTFFGWDEDDEDMSDEEDAESEEDEDAVPAAYEGKGKGKA